MNGLPQKALNIYLISSYVAMDFYSMGNTYKGIVVQLVYLHITLFCKSQEEMSSIFSFSMEYIFMSLSKRFMKIHKITQHTKDMKASKEKLEYKIL